MKRVTHIDFLKLGEKMLAGIALFLPFTVLADLPVPPCPPGLRCDSGGSPTDLIIKIINILLGVAFLIAVLFLIIGGFQFIFSAGNEETATKGKKTVYNALIGIVIIVLSYVIVAIVNRTVGSGGTGSTVP